MTSRAFDIPAGSGPAVLYDVRHAAAQAELTQARNCPRCLQTPVLNVLRLDTTRGTSWPGMLADLRSASPRPRSRPGGRAPRTPAIPGFRRLSAFRPLLPDPRDSRLASDCGYPRTRPVKARRRIGAWGGSAGRADAYAAGQVSARPC